MDAAAKRCGPGRRGRTGAAIEVHSANPLRRKEYPRVMCGAVRVVERNAVEVDIVVTVRKPAEVSLTLAKTDAVAVQRERTGHHLNQLAIVGHWRRKVLDEHR